MKLPISTLKIDRSFVSMIDDSGENDQIVRAIITMAGSLGLKVVGEGVETEAQLRTLRELSCEFGQGCLLAAPMSFDDLCEFVKGEYSLAYPKQRFNDVSEVSVLQ